ncbi:MAG: hypothetical protein M3487_03120 [Actinomycetota bacterium]|nr:hypothetical protein [Acidimicrobiia bacterium]MDQ3468754.1 hypothetical protein [Actinomycetota bacterium]
MLHIHCHRLVVATLNAGSPQSSALVRIDLEGTADEIVPDDSRNSR